MEKPTGTLREFLILYLYREVLSETKGSFTEMPWITGTKTKSVNLQLDEQSCIKKVKHVQNRQVQKQLGKQSPDFLKQKPEHASM